jgi:hypothetical protein
MQCPLGFQHAFPPAIALAACRMKGLFGLGGVAKKLAKKSLQDSFEEMPALMEK